VSFPKDLDPPSAGEIVESATQGVEEGVVVVVIKRVGGVLSGSSRPALPIDAHTLGDFGSNYWTFWNFSCVKRLEIANYGMWGPCLHTLAYPSARWSKSPTKLQCHCNTECATRHKHSNRVNQFDIKYRQAFSSGVNIQWARGDWSGCTMVTNRRSRFHSIQVSNLQAHLDTFPTNSTVTKKW